MFNKNSHQFKHNKKMQLCNTAVYRAIWKTLVYMLEIN